MIPDTTCPITVAQAAPAIPMWKPKIKVGSRIVLMILFGATSSVLDYSLIYTGITSLGFPFLILTTGGTNLVRADGSPKFSMTCTLTGAIINTILDPTLIFGCPSSTSNSHVETKDQGWIKNRIDDLIWRNI